MDKGVFLIRAGFRAVVALGIAVLWATGAQAEGTAQFGTDQDVHPQSKFRVDILKVGEVINISAGINKADSPKPVYVYVRDPSNAQVTGSPFTIGPKKPGFLDGFDKPPPATITNPLQVVAAKVGSYTVTFDNKNQT
jgi:hypothetical protein